MSYTRPTLKALKKIPRSTFRDPVIYDLVAQLSNADKETRIQILRQITFLYLSHPLLEDADSYFLNDSLPDIHKTTKASGNIVYEVRDKTKGAAWRGGVVLLNQQPWLLYADRHDRFHETAQKFFKLSGDKALPSPIDLKLLEQDTKRQERIRREQKSLFEFIKILEDAVENPGNPQTSRISCESKDIDISMCVEPIFDEDVSFSHLHQVLCDLSVSLEISVKKGDLRDLAIKTWIPFLQPNTSLFEVVYTEQGSLCFEILVDYGRVAQLVADGKSKGYISDVFVEAPKYRHYTAKSLLTEAYIEGKAVTALCDSFFVPTKDGQSEALPICPECEKREPIAQKIINLVVINS